MRRKRLLAMMIAFMFFVSSASQALAATAYAIGENGTTTVAQETTTKATTKETTEAKTEAKTEATEAKRGSTQPSSSSSSSGTAESTAPNDAEQKDEEEQKSKIRFNFNIPVAGEIHVDGKRLETQNGSTEVKTGDTFKFEIKVNAGFKLDKASINGGEIFAKEGIYEIIADKDKLIEVKFEEGFTTEAPGEGGEGFIDNGKDNELTNPDGDETEAPGEDAEKQVEVNFQINNAENAYIIVDNQTISQSSYTATVKNKEAFDFSVVTKNGSKIDSVKANSVSADAISTEGEKSNYRVNIGEDITKLDITVNVKSGDSNRSTITTYEQAVETWITNRPLPQDDPNAPKDFITVPTIPRIATELAPSIPKHRIQAVHVGKPTTQSGTFEQGKRIEYVKYDAEQKVTVWSNNYNPSTNEGTWIPLSETLIYYYSEYGSGTGSEEVGGETTVGGAVVTMSDWWVQNITLQKKFTIETYKLRDGYSLGEDGSLPNGGYDKAGEAYGWYYNDTHIRNLTVNEANTNEYTIVGVSKQNTDNPAAPGEAFPIENYRNGVRLELSSFSTTLKIVMQKTSDLTVQFKNDYVDDTNNPELGNKTYSNITWGTSVNAPTKVPQQVEKEGKNYQFIGWDKDSSAWEKVTRSVVINAIYAEQEQQLYSVTYNGNGNTNGEVPVDKNKYILNAEAEILGNIGSLQKNEQRFKEWNTLPDGNGTSYKVGGYITITGDTTLYARYYGDAENEMIRYESNNPDWGTVSNASEPITEGEAVDGSDAIAKKYCNFVHWIDKTTNKVITENNRIIPDATKPAIYVAVFESKKATITTSVVGGTIEPFGKVEFPLVSGSKTIKFSPTKDDYALKAIEINGEPQKILGNETEYTFTAEAVVISGTMDQTIKVIYARQPANEEFGVEGYNKEYDAKSHSVTVTGTEKLQSGEHVEYKLGNGDTWTSNIKDVSFTDVTGGAIRVEVRVVDANGNTIWTGSNTVQITPRNVNIKLYNAEKIHGEDDPAFGYIVENVIDGKEDEIGFTIKRVQGEDVGEYTITVDKGKNPNYNVTVEEAKLTIYGQINYKLNGGNISGNTDDVLDGKYTRGEAAPVNTAITPVLADAAFAGWSTELHAGVLSAEEFKNVTLVNTATIGNTGATLYAVWKKGVHTITLEIVNGQYKVDNIAYEHGATITVEDGGSKLVNFAPRRAFKLKSVTVNKIILDGYTSESYNFENVTEDQTIVVVYSPGPDFFELNGYTGVYDGQPHSISYNKEHVAAGETVRFSTDGGKNWTKTNPTFTDVGTYPVKVELDSYHEKPTWSGEGIVNITKRDVTVSTTGGTKVYGEPDPTITETVESATGNTGLLESETLDYTVNRADGENVGEYQIAVTPGENKNYNIISPVEKNGKVGITQRPITFTGKKVQSPYNGSEQFIIGADAQEKATGIGILDGHTANTDALKIVGTNVGKYATYVDNKGATDITIANGEENVTNNYAISFTPGELEITKINADLNVVNVTPVSFTYDGQSHKPNVATAAASGSKIEYSYDNTNWYSYEGLAGITDATNGAQTVYVRASNDNYEGYAKAQTTLTIGKRTVTFNGVTDNLKYNEQSQTIKGATVVEPSSDTGLVSGHDANTEALTITGTNLGTYTAWDNEGGAGSIVITNNSNNVTANYNVVLNPGTLTITKGGADLNPITVNNENYVYDGQAHKLSESNMPKAKEGTTFYYSYDEQTWVTYENLAGLTNVSDSKVLHIKGVNDKYADSFAKVQINISKRPVNYTVNDAEKFFGDGEPTFTGSFSAVANNPNSGIVGSENFVPTITRPNVATDTAVGTYPGALVATMPAGMENYEVSNTPGTFTIKTKTVADGLTVTSGGGVYNGNGYEMTVELSPEAINAGYNKDNIEYSTDGATWSKTPPTATNVTDTKNIKVRLEQTGYGTLEGNGSITVTPAAITIKANGGEKVYDGTPLTNLEYAITSGAFVGDQGFESVTVVGSQLFPGYSNNEITAYTLKGNTIATNYTITPVDGTLIVTEPGEDQKGTINLSTGSHDPFYNGTEQSFNDAVNTDILPVNVTGISGLTSSVAGTNAGEYNATIDTSNMVITLADGTTITYDQAKGLYNIVVAPGKLNIQKRNVTVTSPDADKLWDGENLTATNVTITKNDGEGGNGFAENEGTVTVTGVAKTVTAVGGIDNTFEISDYNPDNYNINPVFGKLTVYGEVVYNMNGGSGDTIRKGQYANGQTIAIDETVQPTMDRYILDGWSTNPHGPMTPEQANAITDRVQPSTAMGETSLDVYAVWKQNVFTITATAQNGTITPDVENITAIPAGENRTFTYAPNGGFKLVSVTVNGQVVTDGNENGFTFNNISSDNTINVVYKRDGNTVTIDNIDKVYDGNNATLTVDGLLDGDTITNVVVNGATEDDYAIDPNTKLPIFNKVVDNVTVTVTWTDAEGNEHTLTTTVTINARQVAYIVNDSQKTFGEEDPDDYAGGNFAAVAGNDDSGLVGEQTFGMVINRTNAGTDEGEQLGTYDGVLGALTDGSDVSKNYNVVVTPGNFTINQIPAPENATLTLETAEWIYDGAEKSIEAVGDNLPTGYEIQYSSNQIDWTTALPQAKDVADSRQVYVRAVKANSETIEGTPGGFKITAAKATIKVNDASKLYGTEDPAQYSSTITGLIGDNDLGTITYTREIGNDAGTYAIKANYDIVNLNYDVTVTPGAFAIQKRNITIAAESATKTYDGTPLTAGGYRTEGTFAPGEGAAITVNGSISAPGTAVNVVSYTLNANTKAANYNITATNGTLTITAPNTLYQATVTGNSGNEVYDGTQKAVSGVTVSGLGAGHTIVGLDANANGTQVGGYSAIVTGTPIITDALGNNITALYNLTIVPGTLTISGQVFYDVNGGTGEVMDTNTYNLNDTITVSNQTVTRAGTVFLGWSTATTDLITNAAQQGAVNLVSNVTMGTESITLYAVWAIDVNGPTGTPDGIPDYLEYPVIYNANGGTGTVVDNNLYPVGYAVPMAENAFTYDGFVFNGWNVNADGTGTGYEPAQTLAMTEGGINLYAQWALPDGTPVVAPATPATPTPATPATPTAATAAQAAPQLATDVNLEQLADEEVPLANNKLSAEHMCCILQLLIILCALTAQMIYTKDMKKRQARIFELREQISDNDFKGNE